jgi:hypothetical protein
MLFNKEELQLLLDQLPKEDETHCWLFLVFPYQMCIKKLEKGEVSK